MLKVLVASLCLILVLAAACAAPPAPTPPPAPAPMPHAAAWREVEVVGSARGEHVWLAAPLQPMAQDAAAPQAWSYRVYLPNHDGDQSRAAGERPLILLNLLVSIEWDADDAYLQDFETALREASFYLWDVTDGQIAIGQARIVDNRASWWDADIRVQARNTEAPHASIGGIAEQSNPTAYRVQVGPFWNRNLNTQPQGEWRKPDGHRTLAHELAHYVLGLYDEYNLGTKSYSGCAAAPPDDSKDTGASVMNWQYTASELSATAVPGLWSHECEKTRQWEKTKQGAWESVAARFNQSSSTWKILTPDKTPNPGPVKGDWPAALAAIPAITVTHVATGTGSQPLLPDLNLTVTKAPADKPSAVWLAGPGRCAVALGTVAVGGRLPVLGAHSGDTLNATYQPSYGTIWCGEQTLSAPISNSLSLALELRDTCPFQFTRCSEDSPVANPSNAQLWLADFDPDLAQAHQTTWRMQSGATWISPDEFAEIVKAERDLEPPDLAQWAADAAAALVEQGPETLNVAGVGLCLPESDTCTRLPVGVAAYTGNDEQDYLAPLTFSSADGRLQVYDRNVAGKIKTLLILDSPPLAPRNGELRSVSRVYTLAGEWQGSLQAQVQAECCAGDDRRLPHLYRLGNGELVRIEESGYAEQESYVLATIRGPGSYALFR